MVRSCSAYGCTNRFVKGGQFQFHGFPLKNETLLKQWVQKVRRKNFVPTTASSICSAHFRDDDYLNRPGRLFKALKPDAVPSIFSEFPEYYQPKEKKERHLITKLEKRRQSVSAVVPSKLIPGCDIPNDEVTTSTSELISNSIVPNLSPNAPCFKNTAEVTSEVTVDYTSTSRSSLMQVASTQTEVAPIAVVSQLRKRNSVLVRKVKILHQKIRRRNKTISNLQDLLKDLKKKGLIEEDTGKALTSQFGGTTGEIFNNELANRYRNPRGRRYSQEMKKFALTLHYHSPKAYKYCRKVFSLPSPSALTNWLSSVNGEPGFFKEVFNAIKTFDKSEKDCVLMLDGMSIRKQLIWDTKSNSYLGFCDYGAEIDLEPKKTEAKEAIVMMVVGLRKRWKWPIGYFLADSVPGSSLSELIKTALHLCKESNVRIWAITADGHASNLKAFQELGCNLNVSNPDEMVNYFKHPDCDDIVYVILDACHMLKLARNMLGKYRKLICGNEEINWNYLVALNNYQERLGLKFANKLSRSHIEYWNNKMKVKLAAQTLSSSVADALEMLRDAGKPEFKGCGATVEFIRKIDRLFDFLNSRTPFTTSRFKKPLYYDQIEYREESMMEIVRYLYSLTDLQGEPLFYTRRKTFLFGFAAAVKSISAIAKNLLSPTGNFKYLLTYSFSQDHLELFFSRIRRRFGNNNNPNVRQFKTAMKQLLLKNSIDASASANVIAFDDVCEDSGYDGAGIFEIKWSRSKKIELFDDEIDEGEEEGTETEEELLEKENILNQINGADSSVLQGDSQFVDYILYHISGFVVRSIRRRKRKCESCMKQLQMKPEDHNYGQWNNRRIETFTRRKNRGGLIMPSLNVFKVVKYTEKELKRVSDDFNKSKLCGKNIYTDIIRSVTRNMFEIFDTMAVCETEDFGGPSHRVQLIKLISSTYLKLRLHAFAKFHLQKSVVSRRSKNNKNTIFANM